MSACLINDHADIFLCIAHQPHSVHKPSQADRALSGSHSPTDFPRIAENVFQDFCVTQLLSSVSIQRQAAVTYDIFAV